MDQRSFATDTSRTPRDHGDQSELSRSGRWEDEHLDPGAVHHSHLSEHHDDERTDTSVVDQLLPSGSTLHHGDQIELETPKDQGLSASQSDNVVPAPAPCREISALSTIGQAALDLCITATSVYFIAFAVMAFLCRWADPEYSYVAQNLLRAARFVCISVHVTILTKLTDEIKGPTIWPIVFSAIVGRFLTALTAWRLEHGMEVGAVEYITGSRTVFGVLSTPFRLGLLHRFWPILLVLWSLSPLGGQASLRVVSLDRASSNQTVQVSYLDSLTPRDGFTSLNYGRRTDQAFLAALLAPRSIKTNYQDLFGNSKIPLLEDFATPARDGSDDGWYSLEPEKTSEYSSLIGLSMAGIPPGNRIFVNIETSYLYSDCSLTRQYNLSARFPWYRDHVGSCVNGRVAMDFDANFDHNMQNRPTTPREILFGLYDAYPVGGTTARCKATTTYVELNTTCSGRQAQDCVPHAVRRSRLPHNRTTTTWLDGELSSALEFFCESFVNATTLGVERFDPDSVLVRYLADPGDVFPVIPAHNPLETVAVLANLTDAEFSRRFTQLLNTYIIASIAPLSITSNLTRFRLPAMRGSGYGEPVNTTAIAETSQSTLRCDFKWLAVLITSSLVMLAAGIATAILNLKRRAPEVLDSFTSMLRDNLYVHEETGPSTEDASDKVRRLRKMRVILGDVRPMESAGYVALTTRTDGDGVQPLRSERVYY